MSSREAAARSQLKLAIEDVLDSGLPRIYDKRLFEQKCSAVFEHVYENYTEAGTNTYAPAG
jgi:type I restriction enzyme, R subunit